MFQTATYERGDYRVTTDPLKISRAALYRLLGDSYWAQDRPQPVIDESLRRSLCFSLYHHDAMVGFARVITDTVVFGYLCDVIIAPDYRGRGLGKWLLECVVSHPDTRCIRQFSLATRDAHGLYKKTGFAGINNPQIYMERLNPTAYEQYLTADPGLSAPRPGCTSSGTTVEHRDEAK